MLGVRGKPRPRNEREQTLLTKQMGKDVPRIYNGRGRAPDVLKLSDGGPESKAKTGDADPPFAGTPG